MTAELDFLDHLVRESARFAEAIAAAPPEAPVPSCPDWNADDLLWHLGEVQWFWGTVVRERVTRDQAEAFKPPRPADLDCWLWHRPEYTPVTPCGDAEVLAHLQSAIAPGID